MNEKLQKAQQEWQELKQIQEKKGYKPGWIYFRLRDQFGHAIADQVCNQSKNGQAVVAVKDAPQPQRTQKHRVCTCDPFDYIEDGCWCGAEENPYRGW